MSNIFILSDLGAWGDSFQCFDDATANVNQVFRSEQFVKNFPENLVFINYLLLLITKLDFSTIKKIRNISNEPLENVLQDFDTWKHETWSSFRNKNLFLDWTIFINKDQGLLLVRFLAKNFTFFF